AKDWRTICFLPYLGLFLNPEQNPKRSSYFFLLFAAPHLIVRSLSEPDDRGRYDYFSTHISIFDLN
ncbi:MAG: hypothetical protein LLG04_12390, partial [Parachlamydia sp.]|nr:hypothetical protein [Parachlamydia sp.]